MNITLKGRLLPVLMAVVATVAFATTGCISEPGDPDEDADFVSEVGEELASADSDGTPLDNEEDAEDGAPADNTLQGNEAEPGENQEDPPPLPWHLTFTGASSNPAPTPDPGTMSNNGGAPSSGHNNN